MQQHGHEMAVTVMNAVEDYLNELAVVNRSSIEHIRNTRTALRGFSVAIGGKDEFDVPVDAAETDVKKWIASMRAREPPLKDRTVKNYVNAVRGFYDHLVESPDFQTTYNPCTRLSKKLPSGQTQTRRPFKTAVEVAGLIKSITHPRDRCIVTMLAKTGIRRGELCGLDLTDADLNNDILHIRQHLNDTKCRQLIGRKNGETTDIPIDLELHKVLQVYIALRPRTNNPALFLTYDGARLGGKGLGVALQRWVTQYWGANGNATSEKVTAHWFRAFLTYELSIAGCNPVVIAAIRGDRAAKIQDFYTMQVLGFEKIREEFLKAVPVFGL
jgi:integrase